MDPCSNISNLPDELLVEIFSMLPFDDLVHSVQYVCSRWRNIGQDHLLWRDRVFKPHRRLSDANIVNVMKQTPNLQKLILGKRRVKHVVLDAIAPNCLHLRHLEFCKLQSINIRVLRNLLNNCPNIECLSLPVGVLGEEQTRIVALFTKLKTLKIVGGCLNLPCIPLVILADGCPALECFDYGEGNFLTQDWQYFFDKKGAQLHTLAVCWTNKQLKCNLPFLLRCPSLKSFHIRSSLGEEDTVADYSDLRSMKHLTSLRLDGIYNADINHVMRVFQGKSLSRLEELRISFYNGYEDKLAEAIVNNCPKLKILHILECPNLTDTSLQTLHTLKSLENIGLTNAEISNTAITCIRRCKTLKYLNIQWCHVIAEEVMKEIVEIEKLTVLNMCGCNIQGFPFNLVPSHLRNLTLLDIKCCYNVDNDAVAKLRSSMPHLDIRFNYIETTYDRDAASDVTLADSAYLFE